MANKLQVKRTSTSGRTPNTTNSGNTQYIDAGELALNMADGILYTSNGSVLIPVGSNNVNLNITGNATIKAIIANGSIGSAGQTLTSNGTGLYWAVGAGTGTVTQVNTGIGLSGGPISSTGTISVVPNTGIIANATGLYVNATYIGTLTANNATYLGGVASTEYQLESGLAANVATLAANAATYLNGKTESNLNVNNSLTSNNASYLGGVAAASFVQNTDSRTLSGNLVFSANVTLNGLIANGSIGTAGHVLHSDGTKVYWAVDDQGVTSVATGSGLTGGTITSTGTLSVLANTGIIANATGLYVNSAYIGTLSANNTTYVNGKTEGNLNVNSAVVANNASYLGGVLAASYVQNTDSRTLSGNLTFSANVSINGLLANGAIGTAGQVLHSDGTKIYWATDDQGVTSVATGSGLTGGTITTTGTLSVLANTGIIANATGLYVNSAYIGTLSANNASFLGGTGAASYVQNTDSRTLSGNLVFSGANTTFSDKVTINGALNANDVTIAGNLVVSGTVVTVNTATLDVKDINITLAKGAANSLLADGGGITVEGASATWNYNDATASWVSNLPIRIGTGATNVSINTTSFSGTSNNTTYAFGKLEAALNVNSALTANNADYLDGQHGSFYQNATNINTGTLPYAQIPANIINTTAAFTRTGITTFSANVVLGTSGVSANGSFGTAGHTLHTNGTGTYWAADDQGVTSVASGSGLTGGPITATGTLSVLANTGIVANATGLYVNSAYIATLTANAATQLATARNIGDTSFNGTADILPSRMTYKDTRATNYAPFTYQGVSLHLKTNTTDGLSDGGTYHGVLDLAHWSDISGGVNHQLGFTDNNGIYMRSSSNSTTWGSWIEIMTSDSTLKVYNAAGTQVFP